MGFSADVATLRARRFSGWGEVGYRRPSSSPWLAFGGGPSPCGWMQSELDQRPCLFLTFSNSKFLPVAP